MTAKKACELAPHKTRLQKGLELQRKKGRGKGGRDTAASEQDGLEVGDRDDEVVELDASAAIQCALDALLSPSDSDRAAANQDSEEQLLALDVLCLAAQLAGVDLSEDVQAHTARVIYDFWSSHLPGAHCRALLDVLLSKPAPQKAKLVQSILQILADVPFTTKRPVQLLTHIFDSTTSDDLHAYFPNLWHRLVEALYEQSGGQQAAKSLAKLAQREYGDAEDELVDLLRPLILEDKPSLRQIVFENLLPPILQKKPKLSIKLLSMLSLSPSSDEDKGQLSAYLSLARVGAAWNPLLAVEVPEIEDLLATSVTHATPTIRLEALRLLGGISGGSASGRAIPLHHLDLYKKFWKYNIGDSDSLAVRTALVGVWKDFLTRCRHSTHAASRDISNYSKHLAKTKCDREDCATTIAMKESKAYNMAVQGFFSWWVELVIAQLDVTKPYRCQSNALKFLEGLLNEGLDPEYRRLDRTKAAKAKAAAEWPFTLTVVSAKYFVPRLITCVISTYEDIKQAAFAILRRCPISKSVLEEIRQPALKLVAGKRDAEIVSGTLLIRLLCERLAVGTDSNNSALMNSLAGQSEETYVSEMGASAFYSSQEAVHRIIHKQDVTKDGCPFLPPVYPVVSIHEMLAISDSQLQKARIDFAHAAQHEPVHGAIAAAKSVCSKLPRVTSLSLSDLDMNAAHCSSTTSLRNSIKPSGETSTGGVANW